MRPHPAEHVAQINKLKFLVPYICLILLTNSVAGGSSSGSEPVRDFPPQLTSELPFDVEEARVRDLVKHGKIIVAQREFDILAWQAFIALNWPATGGGQADTTKTLADSSSPRVWSFWRPASTIFLPNGDKPLPWGVPASLPSAVNLFRAKAAWRQTSTRADQNFQAFSGPLVDQNGKWVRYEVLVNHEEFDYFVKNELYSLDGQIAFSQREDNNEVRLPANDVRQKQRGAVEIKLAWKELGPNDDRTRFYTTRRKVNIAEPYVAGQAEPQTKEIEVGLVGMHIAMPTRSSPEWIWATFEQIDNVRVNRDSKGKPVHPNFFNPTQPQPNNVLPPKNAIIDPKTNQPVIVQNSISEPTTWVESLTTKPVQVSRVEVPTQGLLNPFDSQLSQSAQEINSQVQQLLKKQNSVFQYYELIGTQWPLHPSAPAVPGGEGSAPESITHKTPGDVIPVFLVNTTMETYFQKGRQSAGPLEEDDRLAPNAPPIDRTEVFGTESCVGCHYSAGICIGFKRNNGGEYETDKATGQRIPIFGKNGHFGKSGSANFSWLLQIEARSRPYQPSKVQASELSPRLDPVKFLDIENLRTLEENKSSNHE